MIFALKPKTMSHADELLSAMNIIDRMKITLAYREQSIEEFKPIIAKLECQKDALSCQCDKLWDQNDRLQAQVKALQAQVKALEAK